MRRDLFSNGSNPYGYQQPKREQVALPSVAGVVDLLNRAKATGLKYPKLWLQFPNGKPLRVSIAGDGSRTPGYLMLTDDGKYPDNQFYGRISPTGALEIGRHGHAVREELVALLTQLAKEPAKVAADYGHLTGHCCFCGLKLKDERSSRVGYGPNCAKKYSLPWGVSALTQLVLE